MGNSEENKSPKSEKPFSPAAPDQTNNIHLYPDWAAMQAYYGPRVAVPPPYAIASGHPHPYMWGPPQSFQTMVPPYGTPYAALYAPGGVYAPHPGVPLGSHPNGHVVSPSPASVTEAMTVVPLSMDMPAKSSTTNTDNGLLKKLKGFDGLAMSIGNGNNCDRAGPGADNGISQSEDTEGSSDGSDGNTANVGQNNKKRSREGTSNDNREGKSVTPKSPIHSGDPNGTSSKVTNVVVTPPSDADKVTGAVLSPNMTTMLELKNPSGGGNLKASPAGEVWLQNERELKRERRKQSNRESARRSRLRKQAETEELAKKVHALTAENRTLRSEIDKLTQSSEQLKIENGTIMEKLKNARLGHAGDLKFNETRVQPISTANLLARVNNSGPADRSEGEGNGFGNSNNTKSGAKLHQLLDASPRTDTVAAG